MLVLFCLGWKNPVETFGFPGILTILFSAFSELLEFITSGPVVAMEILGDDAIGRWKQLLGPANSVVARTDAPNSIRARFGSDSIRNVAHGPDSFASAASVSFSNIHLISHSVQFLLAYKNYFYFHTSQLNLFH